VNVEDDEDLDDRGGDAIELDNIYLDDGNQDEQSNPFMKSGGKRGSSLL
jgi:hypothetical protein